MDCRSEKHEKYILEGDCPVKAFEELDVTVPMEVHAFAEIGEVTCCCLDSARITRNADKVRGCPHACSKFTISQKLRVDIPITFVTETEVGEAHIDFESFSSRGNHEKCDECDK